LSSNHVATLCDDNHPRTQVSMYTGGVLEMHDNVVFKANTAGTGEGGAVSLPFNIGFHIHVASFWDRFCEGGFDSL